MVASIGNSLKGRGAARAPENQAAPAASAEPSAF